VQEVTWEGTHSGELEIPQGTIPASNRRVTIYAVQVVECEDGHIRENRHYFDMLGMLQQLGAMG
jgi:predicted ester cyclase